MKQPLASMMTMITVMDADESATGNVLVPSLSDADGNALGVRQPAGTGHPNAGERNFIQSLTQTLENEWQHSHGMVHVHKCGCLALRTQPTWRAFFDLWNNFLRGAQSFVTLGLV